MGSLYALLSILWFTTIVLLLNYIRKWLMSPKVQNIIDKATGLVLIGFGLNMIFKVQNRIINKGTGYRSSFFFVGRLNALHESVDMNFNPLYT
ncbi:LysE family transporter [Paenibacillus polymyxa]|nr:LysE family transporter [Paenibacillus polymyxa]